MRIKIISIIIIFTIFNLQCNKKEINGCFLIENLINYLSIINIKNNFKKSNPKDILKQCELDAIKAKNQGIINKSILKRYKQILLVLSLVGTPNENKIWKNKKLIIREVNRFQSLNKKIESITDSSYIGIAIMEEILDLKTELNCKQFPKMNHAIKNSALKAKYKLAMGDLREIGKLVESFIIDKYEAPNSINEIFTLTEWGKQYKDKLPNKDPWGNNYLYKKDKFDKEKYWIGCAGNDDKFEGFNQKGTYEISENKKGQDIIFSNGVFVYLLKEIAEIAEIHEPELEKIYKKMLKKKSKDELFQQKIDGCWLIKGIIDLFKTTNIQDKSLKRNYEIILNNYISQAVKLNNNDQINDEFLERYKRIIDVIKHVYEDDISLAFKKTIKFKSLKENIVESQGIGKLTETIANELNDLKRMIDCKDLPVIPQKLN
jgi:hypothetical protein